VPAKIREVVGAVVGVNGEEERIACQRIRQPLLVEGLESRFDILGRELERFFGNVAGGAASAISMNVREVHIEKDLSAGWISCRQRRGRALGWSAKGRGEQGEYVEVKLGFHIRTVFRLFLSFL
jgi:hypothetical protein